MKLTTRQLDALASEIRMQLLKKKEVEKEKEKYISHYLEIIKASGFMDKINDAFNSQIIREMYLDLPNFFDFIGLQRPGWHTLSCVKKDCIEESLKRIIGDTYNNGVPFIETIKHRLVLESIALGQDETIDEFISRMVEKFE